MSPASAADLAAPIHLVKGDDPVLVGDAVRDLVAALVGDGDRTLMVEELDAARLRGRQGRLQHRVRWSTRPRPRPS